MLDKEILRDYNRYRKTRNKQIFCHAPFTSLNFEQNGNATVCCYNRKHILGTYPRDTIRDMWFGESAEQLRNFMKKNHLPLGCELCYDQFQSRNFAGLRANSYDSFADLVYFEKKGRFFSMPKVMEFEISNVCNLECTMCNGYFSSSIRRNREKLDPLVNPYDDSFVDQLKAFIPYLVEARFLGGEPFLINIYYDIWDLISKLKPDTQIRITTNGTILNDRVKNLLEKINVNIIVSIDSLEEENYERIRANAKFKKLMANFSYFKDYTIRKDTGLCVTVCPMQQNWHELPNFLRFCNERNIYLYFNTVTYPPEATLQTLGFEELCKIVDYLKSFHSYEKNLVEKSNNSQYRDVVNQISFYRDNAFKTE